MSRSEKAPTGTPTKKPTPVKKPTPATKAPSTRTAQPKRKSSSAVASKPRPAAAPKAKKRAAPRKAKEVVPEARVLIALNGNTAEELQAVLKENGLERGVDYDFPGDRVETESEWLARNE